MSHVYGCITYLYLLRELRAQRAGQSTSRTKIVMTHVRHVPPRKKQKWCAVGLCPAVKYFIFYKVLSSFGVGVSYSLSGDGAFNFQTTNPVKKTQPKFARRPARRFLRLRPSLRQARGRFLALLQGCPVDGQRAPRDGAPAPPPSDSTRQDWRVGSAHGRRLVLTETVGSATLEAAGSSTRGSGWAPSGPVSPPGSAEPPRAAQSRQARLEEAEKSK